jgi:hypothetical protein
VRRDPVFDLGLASEIHHRAAWIAQQSARFALKPAHYGAAHHTMLTGDPDRLIGKVKEHRRIFTFSSALIAVGSKPIRKQISLPELPSFLR